MAGSRADTYLVDAVCRGDADAWRDLIARYEGRLLSFARRRLADQAEAEDIVQETFLGLLRSLPTYDRNRSLETYLFAILRNKLHDHFRRLHPGRRQSLEQLEPDEAPSAWLDTETPSRHAAARESADARRRALCESLRRWVEQCRVQRRFQELIAIEMLVVLGMRNKEVAADLGLGETAVAGIKFRVLQRWRDLAASVGATCDWQEDDLRRDSPIGQIWRQEGISCLKRSTLGRYLLGALDEDWTTYVQFHTEIAGCERCLANLDDLRSEDARDDAARQQWRQRCFASSVGFLSRVPNASDA